MKPIKERIVAEEDADGWLILWPDGSVTHATTREGALRAIKSSAQKRVGKSGVIVTEIEWRPL